MPARKRSGVTSAGRPVIASVTVGALPGLVTVRVADALLLPPSPVKVKA
jgi:hypothetical protein